MIRIDAVVALAIIGAGIRQDGKCQDGGDQNACLANFILNYGFFMFGSITPDALGEGLSPDLGNFCTNPPSNTKNLNLLTYIFLLLILAICGTYRDFWPFRGQGLFLLN